MSQPASNPENLNASAEVPPIPDPGFEPQVSKSTLGLWGSQLPIGYLTDGMFHRDVQFKPYTMAAERELAKHRKSSKTARNPAQLASIVIATMASRLGPFGDFQAMSLQKRLHIVNQMYMGDVLYAYMLLRIEALGSEMAMSIECPACGAKSELMADLEDLDLLVPETPASLVRSHKLFTPIKLNGDKGEINHVYIQPPRWSSMSSMKLGRQVDVSVIKFDLVMASIMATDVANVPFHKGMLDSLTKRDFEYLVKAVDDNTPGPDMMLSWECPACGEEGQQSMRWDFDHFFGSSSL